MSEDDWCADSWPEDERPSVPEERERAVAAAWARIAAQQAGAGAAASPARAAAPPEAGAATLRSPPQAANEVSPSPAPSPVQAAPAHLRRTDRLPDAARAVALAIARPPSPPSPSPRRPAPRTAQSRLMGMGGTTPVGDDRLAAARDAATTAPSLSLRQYASLCAEISLWPDQAEAILRRYQVYSHAERVALDAHFRRERAARPEVNAAFERDVAAYTVHLHRQFSQGR
ncbi:MAG: hypothetical protein QM820_23790 [Minicystis sp.]